MAFIIGSRNVDIIGDDEDVSGDDIIITGRGADIIISGDGDDLIFSGSGDDTIEAGDGDDVVFAGSGNDTVDGGNGDDFIVGGSGNDILTDGAGNDILLGSSGVDSFTYNYNANVGYSDFFHGGSGVDNITLQFTNANLQQLATDLGYADGDAYLAALENYFDNSGRFKDLSDFGFNLYLKKIEELNIQIDANVIDGTDGDDNLDGSNQDDIVNAGNGNDTVNGNDGNDTIQGEGGDDNLDGGAGNDVLSGGDGNDVLSTGAGDDVALGGNGDDTLIIDSVVGNNTLDGGTGSNVLNVTAGISTLAVANTAPQSVLTLLNGSSSNSTATNIQTLNVASSNFELLSLDLSDVSASSNSLTQINSSVAAAIDLSMNAQNTLDFVAGINDSSVLSNGSFIGLNNFNQYTLSDNNVVNIDKNVDVSFTLDELSSNALNINWFDETNGNISVNGAERINIEAIENSISTPGGDTFAIDFDAQSLTRVDNAVTIDWVVLTAAVVGLTAVNDITASLSSLTDKIKATLSDGIDTATTTGMGASTIEFAQIGGSGQYSFDAEEVEVAAIGSWGERIIEATGILEIILGENTPGNNLLTVTGAQSLIMNFEDSIVVPGQDIIEIDVDNFTATRLDNAVTVDWVVLNAAIVGLGVAVLTSVGNGAEVLANKVENELTSQNLDLAGTEYELTNNDDYYEDAVGEDRAMTTNGGNDTLVYFVGNGNDTINDFEQGADKIDITAYGYTDVSQLLTALNPNNSTLIDLGDGNSITLDGISGGLTNDDFVGFTGGDPYTAFDDFVTLTAGEAVTFNLLTDEFNNTSGADIRGEFASITNFSSLPNPIVAGTELDEIFVRYLDANIMSDLQALGYEIGATLVEGSTEGEFTYDSNFKYAHINSGNSISEDALNYTASHGATTDTANINININGTDVDQAVLGEGFGATLNGSLNQDFYRVDDSAFEWIINSGLGRDLITVEGDNNIIDGGDGADLVIVKGLADIADNPVDNATNNVVDGGAGDDILIAGRLSDGTQFNGGDGDDILIVGHASVLNSSLEGGQGEDILVGHNSVVDTFKLNTGGDLDFIDNFTSGQDKIDLSAFGTITELSWSEAGPVAFKGGFVDALSLSVNNQVVAVIEEGGTGLDNGDFV